MLFTTGVSLFLSCANLFFRDVKYIVQVVLMFGIFFTPIFFEPAMLGPKGAYLAMLNPLTGILEGLRLSVVEGHNLLEPLTVVVKGVPRVAWEPWELAVLRRHLRGRCDRLGRDVPPAAASLRRIRLRIG